jgi:Tol biopolymer transport system component
VPAAGGAVRHLTSGVDGSGAESDGNWSPDGASLIFGATFGDASTEQWKRLVLERVDVTTQRIARLPGTEGLWSPRWSPDRRYIAAMGFPNRLWLYDVQTRTRKQLTQIGAGWPNWSRDSQDIYFESSPGTEWYRVRIRTRYWSMWRV